MVFNIAENHGIAARGPSATRLSKPLSPAFRRTVSIKLTLSRLELKQDACAIIRGKATVATWSIFGRRHAASKFNADEEAVEMPEN
jgi:hypothetical protein